MSTPLLQGDPVQYSDPCDLRAQLAEARAELQDQREVNSQLKGYMGEVLVNILDKEGGDTRAK